MRLLTTHEKLSTLSLVFLLDLNFSKLYIIEQISKETQVVLVNKYLQSACSNLSASQIPESSKEDMIQTSTPA